MLVVNLLHITRGFTSHIVGLSTWLQCNVPHPLQNCLTFTFCLVTWREHVVSLSFAFHTINTSLNLLLLLRPLPMCTAPLQAPLELRLLLVSPPRHSRYRLLRPALLLLLLPLSQKELRTQHLKPILPEPAIVRRSRFLHSSCCGSSSNTPMSPPR
jgi:hypothetical protein